MSKSIVLWHDCLFGFTHLITWKCREFQGLCHWIEQDHVTLTVRNIFFLSFHCIHHPNIFKWEDGKGKVIGGDAIAWRNTTPTYNRNVRLENGKYLCELPGLWSSLSVEEVHGVTSIEGGSNKKAMFAEFGGMNAVGSWNIKILWKLLVCFETISFLGTKAFCFPYHSYIYCISLFQRVWQKNHGPLTCRARHYEVAAPSAREKRLRRNRTSSFEPAIKRTKEEKATKLCSIELCGSGFSHVGTKQTLVPFKPEKASEIHGSQREFPG